MGLVVHIRVHRIADAIHRSMPCVHKGMHTQEDKITPDTPYQVVEDGASICYSRVHAYRRTRVYAYARETAAEPLKVG